MSGQAIRQVVNKPTAQLHTVYSTQYVAKLYLEAKALYLEVKPNQGVSL